MTAQEALRTYFGYENFRPTQQAVIESLLRKRDTLALLPTGGGKSICFQVPALMQEGLCLVITPLVSLMKDQVDNLKKRRIKAAAIFSGLTEQEIRVVFDNCQFGNYKFLYISPERLESPQFMQRVVSLPIIMIAVDEAHCISQWGYDFRPSYLNISAIRVKLPNAPILALTATATPEVVSDIQHRLGFAEENVFRQTFRRENLIYAVRYTDDKQEMLLRILNGVPGTSVVYVRSRQKTKDIAEYLVQNGIKAEHYHAGLSHDERDIRQRNWKTNLTRVIVATNAFGMGIDKPDVRTVVHLDLPDTLEAYFQEAGRAGRDGKRAYAVLLYNEDDKTKARKRIQDNYPTEDFIRSVYQYLADWWEIGVGSGMGHTFPLHLDDFCSAFHLAILPTQSALQILSSCGYIRFLEEQESQPRVTFVVERDTLYDISMSARQEKIVMALMRRYGGIFSDFVYIHDDRLAEDLNMRQKDVNHELIELSRLGVLRYIPRQKVPLVAFSMPRIDAKLLNFPHQHYAERLEQYQSKLAAMVHYAEQREQCRSQVLLSYFGETDSAPCQYCDVCQE